MKINVLFIKYIITPVQLFNYCFYEKSSLWFCIMLPVLGLVTDLINGYPVCQHLHNVDPHIVIDIYACGALKSQNLRV